MLTNTLSDYNKFYERLSEVLDITPSQFEKARQHYGAVSDWLSKEGSGLRKYSPDIYVQGSFSLGTVIKPLSGLDEYDIDLVCKLDLSKSEITQESLKQKVGDRLKENTDYERMLQNPEGQFCWTLDYKEVPKFSMDILPAIKDDYLWLLELSVDRMYAESAICISDNKDSSYQILSQTWRKSNPKAYVEWFKSKMKITFDNRRRIIAESRSVTIDKVQEYEVKTPLQRAVQILKRHRDVMYGDDEDKPISIIITTLSAKAYGNESNIVDSLKNILLKMELYIEKRGDVTWIENPVNPTENFADQWENSKQKEVNFRAWLTKAKRDLVDIVGRSTVQGATIEFREVLGQKYVNEAFRNAGLTTTVESVGIVSRLKSLISSVNHQEAPSWTMNLTNTVSVHARYKDDSRWITITPKTVLPKGKDIMFVARTNVQKPYDVYWQVVNTGEEAKAKGQLRGEIYKSKTAGAGGLKQKEATSYSGVHWIECYIIKRGVCVARSNEIFVRIE